jgi:hypothetical protein
MGIQSLGPIPLAELCHLGEMLRRVFEYPIMAAVNSSDIVDPMHVNPALFLGMSSVEC